jgi:hypothetical protein
MSLLASPRFLRQVLWADAASGAATGLLHLSAGATLAALLGLPATLITGSGLLLLAYVALAGWLATQDPLPRTAAWVLVAGNWAWVAACLVLLFGGSLAPTLAGQVYLAVQAFAVAVLAELQMTGLRRQARPPGWA